MGSQAEPWSCHYKYSTYFWKASWNKDEPKTSGLKLRVQLHSVVTECTIVSSSCMTQYMFIKRHTHTHTHIQRLSYFLWTSTKTTGLNSPVVSRKLLCCSADFIKTTWEEVKATLSSFQRFIFTAHWLVTGRMAPLPRTQRALLAWYWTI